MKILIFCYGNERPDNPNVLCLLHLLKQVDFLKTTFMTQISVIHSFKERRKATLNFPVH